MSAGPSWQSRRLHFTGIGGAGMSGLAAVCHELGATVTGSDRSDSSYMERLRRAGIAPVIGHEAANLPEGADLVVSTAIAAENPELSLARERGQRVLHRADLLAELCAGKRLIAVAGTHGKTTTSSMLVWALRRLGEDPSFFIGGEVPGLGPEGSSVNAGLGSGEWVVAEADESDGSFEKLRPEIAVVTNVEMDHHSTWGSLAELTAAFERFLKPARGVVVPAAGGFDPVRRVPGNTPSEILFERAVAGHAEHRRFSLEAPGPSQLELAVPGAHNVANARAAVAAVELAGLGSGVGPDLLAGFGGVGRRLELKGTYGGAAIVDDYAHHPTEVRAALMALREQDHRRLIVVFQPHLYSRTKMLASEFGAALALADAAVVLDVYPAREEPVGPLAGVSGLDVARETADRSGGRPVVWAPDLAGGQRAAARMVGPGDVLVTLGAGEVRVVADGLVAAGERA